MGLFPSSSGGHSSSEKGGSPSIVLLGRGGVGSGGQAELPQEQLASTLAGVSELVKSLP